MKHRLTAVKATMEAQNIDVLLISDKINRRYLSGFTGSNGLLAVGLTQDYLLIDGRYTEQAQQQTKDIRIITTTEQNNQWQHLAKIVGAGTLGFEGGSISYQMFSALRKLADDQGGHLIETQNLIEELRMFKSDTEITALRKAAGLADQTFSYIISIIKSGMSELDAANEIDYYSKRIGSEGPAFETIVASGIRTALPHAHASKKIIQENELIMIDFGCISGGYYSDMTRTFALGKVDDGIKRTYDQVLQAQRQAIEAVKTGRTLAEIDAAARSALSTGGLAEYFSHGLGHGIGLSCHEYPAVNQLNQLTIQPRMSFTVEPGVYIPSSFGIRIEDDIFVTADGEVELLTKTNKEWMTIE
ncbi:M24 family metallopeptidase [Enterococcus sp. LJL128]